MAARSKAKRVVHQPILLVAVLFAIIGGYIINNSRAATTTTAPLQTILNPTPGQYSNWNWNARTAPLDPQGDIGQTYSNNFINNGINAAGARVLVQTDYAVATATFTPANSDNDCSNIKAHWGGVKVDLAGHTTPIIGGQSARICMPGGTTITKGDPSDDGHLSILDLKNGLEYDIYQYHDKMVEDDGTVDWDNTSTPQIEEVGGIAVFPIGTVNETNDLPSSSSDGCPGCWSGNAASTPLQRGLITPEDLNAAITAANRSLPYTLQFSIPNIPGNSTSFRFPGGHNTPTGSKNSLSEGWWVRLDPSINVDALSIPNWQKVIAKTLQEHGAINRDNGGAFGFYGRNPINGETSWTSVSGLSSGVSTAFASNFPWSSMQVLAAPADCTNNPSHITCGNTSTPAGTYYVSPTGNDSNNGTSTSTPLKTIQAGVNKATIAGNTVIVMPGTYNLTATVAVNSSGTSGNLITIKSQTKGGAILDGANTVARGFKLNGDYIKIENFEIRNFADPQESTGIEIYAGGGDNSVITGNNIHNIGNVCSSSSNGLTGIFASGTGLTIEQNYIHDIGRTIGCSSDRNHDHGIYLDQATNSKVRNNVFNNIQSGFEIQLYPSHPTIIDGVSIENNTFANCNTSKNSACMIIGDDIPPDGPNNPLKNVTIRNNLFYIPSSGSAIEWYNGQYTGFNFNVINNATSGANFGSVPAGVNLPTGQTGKTFTFVNAAGGDFHLTSADTGAKDKGVTSANVTNDFDGVTRPQGSAYDIGAFEFVGATSSCSTTPGDITGDNHVTIADISALLTVYGQTNSTNCADLDKNGSVNLQDFSIILQHYGT